MRVVRLVEDQHHRDVEGRPLREGRTPAAHLRDGDLEYRRCPYTGSRAGRGPINVGALRQTTARWDELVDALAFVRTAYADVRGAYGPDLLDVWRVSQLASALPWFFVVRDEPAPAYAAALAKVVLGTGMLAHRLLHDMLVHQAVPPPLAAETLLDLAESTGLLVGETEVCAAPGKLIIDFGAVLVDGRPSATGVGEVAALRARRAEVLWFAAHYTGFKLLAWIHHLARRFLYADVGATALLAAPCEPPDCVVIEPPALAAVAPPLRGAWFGMLAQLVVPLAPDASDRPLGALAAEVATIMGAGAPPGATYRALDASFGEVLRVVERGLGGTPPAEVDAATRDRVLAADARAVLAHLP